jgi:hypothetical protein
VRAETVTVIGLALWQVNNVTDVPDVQATPAPDADAERTHLAVWGYANRALARQTNPFGGRTSRTTRASAPSKANWSSERSAGQHTCRRAEQSQLAVRVRSRSHAPAPNEANWQAGPGGMHIPARRTKPIGGSGELLGHRRDCAEQSRLAICFCELRIPSRRTKPIGDLGDLRDHAYACAEQSQLAVGPAKFPRRRRARHGQRSSAAHAARAHACRDVAVWTSPSRARPFLASGNLARLFWYSS